jgi:hypothetical protein
MINNQSNANNAVSDLRITRLERKGWNIIWICTLDKIVRLLRMLDAVIAVVGLLESRCVCHGYIEATLMTEEMTGLDS